LEKFTKYVVLLIFILPGISCQRTEPKTQNSELLTQNSKLRTQNSESLPIRHLTELQPCDILVKPNLNFIPGTTFVPGGALFGHAAIVIVGASDTNEVALLSKTITFESQARDVPGEYQLRKIAAYLPGNDNRFANNSFIPDRLCNLYRLRMDLTDAQRKAIISFIEAKDNDLSSYRAMKRYNHEPGKGNDSHLSHEKQEYWYCSLLIWQAFYDVLGIDIDANGGVYVHPNDLINSPYFNDNPGRFEKKVRF
jgi:hypothetical protein